MTSTRDIFSISGEPRLHLLTLECTHLTLLRDEEHYPDPDAFDPERLLKNSEIDPKTLDPIPIFGFARRSVHCYRSMVHISTTSHRICPGRFFAMDSLLISVVSVLSCFDIAKAKNKEGQEIEPKIRWTSGFSRCVLQISCLLPVH